jgi:hypothetical protein
MAPFFMRFFKTSRFPLLPHFLFLHLSRNLYPIPKQVKRLSLLNNHLCPLLAMRKSWNTCSMEMPTWPYDGCWIIVSIPGRNDKDTFFGKPDFERVLRIEK